jgi:hypothetical protein
VYLQLYLLPKSFFLLRKTTFPTEDDISGRRFWTAYSYEELNKLMADVIIAQGGVLPNIQANIQPNIEPQGRQGFNRPPTHDQPA